MDEKPVNIAEKLLKPYQPQETEKRIYELWEQSGFFNPDNLEGEPYTICIAPPNVTGNLHMGHALENVISDILIRFERMRGKKTLWLPGTDHAGIATQNAVEKSLKKEGISRHDLGREKFLEKVWEWKEKYGNIILDQLKQLGCSLDWSRTRFTMDEKYQEAVKRAFRIYQEQGLIYRGKRVINWCIKDQTALSDLELEYESETGKLWQIKYQIKNTENFITVATTRPETLLGDTAVAVNPDDARYKNLIGETVIIPIVNREVKIIADPQIDQDFGTGAVKVTPAHDMFDSELGERHGLEKIQVINEVGKIINTQTEFDGLKILEAREKIVEKLRELNLLISEEAHTHNVAKCYRCHSTVEPLLSEQWFLKMKPLAEKLLEKIKNGEVQYHPERWQKIATDWLENIRDWCISRQIWWGHRIPIENSDDTFDTWFSSALWPLATLGWPDENATDFRTFYPTQVITSARDIIHLWISRMLISGLTFANQLPFKNILIHATVLNKTGQRMSKSLGTGLDPLEMIAKYGADATRFGLIYQEFGGQEIKFGEDNILMGKKFANKIWNITRYILTKTDNKITDQKPEENHEILVKLEEVKKKITNNLENYQFGEASHTIYDFVWHDLADKYLEETKNNTSPETQKNLAYLLDQVLKLLHPFMPFITEEIWQIIHINSNLEQNQTNQLIIASWPSH
ncbi:MAG: valine--tRNA ligase [Patescibacteria group bacterium]